MPFAAITYRVKPGHEDEIAEIFAGFQRVDRPDFRDGRGEAAGRLLGTAVFIKDDVMVRVIHYEGDFAQVGRHMAAQQGVHLVEDALRPYLAQERDTADEAGFGAYFRDATMRCVSQLSVDTLPAQGVSPVRELKVSVIGLGGMGAGMARALLAAGFATTVHNRTAAKAEPLAELGATVAASAADAAADADVVLFSLADEAAVEQVLFGEVIWKLRPGTTVVDTSTVSPAFARDTAIRLAASGVHRVEACVIGNPVMAAAGQLRVFAAGVPEEADGIADVLGALSQEVRHLGPAGRASTLKLAFNLLLGVQTAALAETVGFAEGAGLDRELLLDALDKSGWRSPVLSFRSEFMRNRSYRPAGFRAALMHKDLRLAGEEAQGHAVPLPLANLAATRFAEVIAAGRGDEDAAVVVEVVPSPAVLD